MDFREIGFERFIKHYAEKHILDTALREAYNAGYEDGWRDKKSKTLKENPSDILFVMEKSFDTFIKIKNRLLDKITNSTNHKISLNNGDYIWICSPEQVRQGSISGLRFNRIYVDESLKGDEVILEIIKSFNREGCVMFYTEYSRVDDEVKFLEDINEI